MAKNRFKNILDNYKFFNKFTIFILELVVIIILIVFFLGTIKTLLDVILFLDRDLQTVVRRILVDIFNLLALVEGLRTVNSYLNEGRVRVTFIVDTVIILTLNELSSSWYIQINLINVLALLIIILVLMLIRILAIRFHPEK